MGQPGGNGSGGAGGATGPGEAGDPAAARREARAVARERAAIAQQMRTEQMAAGGAAEFQWIAGLSVVNSILIWTGANFMFVIGLGFTLITDAFFLAVVEGGGMPRATAMPIALAVDVAAAAVFVVFGIFARRGHAWAWIFGMLCYAVDGAILVPFEQWLAIAFHVFILLRLVGGWKAMRRLRAAEAPVGGAAAEGGTVWDDAKRR